MEKKTRFSEGKLAVVESSSAVEGTKFYVVAGERQRYGNNPNHFLIP